MGRRKSPLILGGKAVVRVVGKQKKTTQERRREPVPARSAGTRRAGRSPVGREIVARWHQGSTGQYARKSHVKDSGGIASVLPGATVRA